MKPLLYCSLCLFAASRSAAAQQSPFFFDEAPAGKAPKAQRFYETPVTTRVDPPHAFTPSRGAWDTLYFGANAGWSGGDFRYPLTVASSTGVELGSGAIGLKSSGFVGGGFVGFTSEMGNNLVGGLEADIQGADLTDRISLDAGPLSIKLGSKVDFLGTARARLGALVVADKGLLYATGGLAYAAGSSYIAASDGVNSARISKDALSLGWTVGGGFEYAMTERWSFRTEYLYVDLGRKKLVEGAVLTDKAALSIEPRANIVRAGVAYRFGAPDSISARY